MSNPQSQKVGKVKASKGLFKYYQVIIRSKSGIGPDTLESLRHVIKEFLDDTPLRDIMARKANKPRTIKWVVG